MKSKKLTLAFSLIVVFALAVGIVLPCAIGNTTADNVAFAAAGNYYSSITATKGTALLGQLHDLIVKTHTHYSSYNDCKNPTIIKKTDSGKTSGTVMEFYTQQDMSSTWGSGKSGTWNREHVWCQSLSKDSKTGTQLWGETGGGGDLHHIRPAETDLNGKRGNKLYGEAPNGNAQYATGISGVVGGYISGNTFEPIDNVKGDVARIVMYVYTHYNNASNVGGTTESAQTHGNLPITNIIAASGETAAWTLLLKWNKLDPVDDIERNRNEAVYAIQGNRNPFIDNENYADAIWGNGSTQPVELQSISLTPNTFNLTVGATQTLSVQATPANANAKVTWSSSDTSVATVNNGVVTAVSAGTATITATSTANTNIKATATVTVKMPKKATAIELIGSPTVTQYQEGQIFNPAGLTVKVTYDDGTISSYSSTDDLNQFQWLDADTNQQMMTVSTTAIKCKYGDIEQIGSWTVTVTAPPEQISGFIDSVSAISEATTLKDRFDSIKNALTAYNQLTAVEKNNESAVGAYQTLQQAIADYNADAASNNEVMQKATSVGAYAICNVAVAAAAVVAVLNRKFN